MINNKVSDKVIWEEGVTSDNDFIPTASQPQYAFQPMSQTQMMFCYKCNNVIPSDSKFCPCCKTELYTLCPRCGVKYSSQYSICNQCGTDRLEYLQAQRREQERKAAIEKEKLDQRQKEERKRKETEAERERLQQEYERKQKSAYHMENNEIIRTEEYKSAYELFLETNKMFEKRKQKLNNCFLLSLMLPFIYLLFDVLVYDLSNQNMDLFFTILIILGFLEILGVIVLKVFYLSEMARKTFFLQYISKSNGYNKGMINSDLVQMVNYQGIERFKDCYIIAYREKHKLSINYKCHNLRKC